MRDDLAPLPPCPVQISRPYLSPDALALLDLSWGRGKKTVGFIKGCMGGLPLLASNALVVICRGGFLHGFFHLA